MLLIGFEIGFFFGASLGALFIHKAYQPFIKELDERVEYWYNFNKIK